MDRILNCLGECFKITKSENVLIITDRKKIKAARKFENAARKLSNSVSMIKIKPTGQHGREPDKITAKKMLGYDVIIMITRWSLSHTMARRNASKKGARIASLPNFTESMIDALDIDYKKLEKNSKKLLNKIKGYRKFRITTRYGTDIRFDFSTPKNTKRCMDIADIRKKGSFSNLPAGEVGWKLTNARGVLVFDSYQNIINKPTKLIIKNNRVLEFEKSKNGRIMKKLLSVKNGKYLAEFAIGTNPKAKPIKNVLQDEKVLGTCHIAFGSNISYDGRNKSPVHIDVILFRPTIKVDNEIIMKNGVPLW